MSQLLHKSYKRQNKHVSWSFSTLNNINVIVESTVNPLLSPSLSNKPPPPFSEEESK